MKFGTVTILGRPNVGKSTLLNSLLNEKIAIVSDNPQTTRTRILGIVHRPDAQIVFLDTPGLHKPSHLLNKRMVRTALETMREADLLYVMVDATGVHHDKGGEDTWVLNQVRHVILEHQIPVFLLINKVDLVHKTRLLPLIQRYHQIGMWAEIIPLSGKTGVNVERLLECTERYLEQGEARYADDMVTDQPMRGLAAEIIREKLLWKTSQELPHAIAVEVERFVEEKKVAKIDAVIFVERETQKPIIVGKKGDRLKEVGRTARLEMERLFGMKVYLGLWVKVKKGWREDQEVLTELGY